MYINFEDFPSNASETTNTSSAPESVGDVEKLETLCAMKVASMLTNYDDIAKLSIQDNMQPLVQAYFFWIISDHGWFKYYVCRQNNRFVLQSTPDEIYIIGGTTEVGGQK